MNKASLLKLVFLLFFLQGCSGYTLAKQTFTFELGTQVYANPSAFLKDQPEAKDLEVVVKSPGIFLVDNSFLPRGEDHLPVGYYDFALVGNGKEMDFRIKIKDTRPPVINQPQSHVEIETGQEIDWHKIFDASDLSDVIYDVVEGEIPQWGTGTVTVRVSDRFGNSVDQKVEVTRI